MKNDNIFENTMAAFDFMADITDRIVYDWKESGAADEEKLYEWLENGFIDSLEKNVKRAVSRWMYGQKKQ